MLIDTNFWRQENKYDLPNDLVLKILQEAVKKIKPEELEAELDYPLRNLVMREVRSVIDQYTKQDFTQYMASHFETGMDSDSQVTRKRKGRRRDAE